MIVDDVEANLDLPNMVEYVQKKFETYFNRFLILQGYKSTKNQAQSVSQGSQRKHTTVHQCLLEWKQQQRQKQTLETTWS